MVTWQNTSSGDLQFFLNAERYRSSDAYIAIAFSDDHRMGDDSVIGCFEDGGSFVAKPSYNEGTENHRITTTGWITDVEGNTSYPEMSCTFTRQINAPDSRFFDLGNDFYIMLVTGILELKHGVLVVDKHQGIPWMSVRKVDFQIPQVVGPYKLFSPLVKLHGSMMILAWVLFSWIGIMTARYNKGMLPEKKLFGTKVWFQVHRMLMVSVLLCVVVGFIAIFVEIRGYSQITPEEEGYMDVHPVLGIIITVFVILNVIGANLRPSRDHKFRWIFNWAHMGIGVLAQLLAAISMFFGYFSSRANLSNAPAYVTGSHLFVSICVALFLEYRRRTFVEKKINEDGVANYGGVNTDDKMKLKDGTPKQDRAPFNVLVLFSLVTIGIAVTLLLIIALK